MLNELGTVKHIVLPVTALEHKAFFGPLCGSTKAATWVAPGQYGPFGALTRVIDEASGKTTGYMNSLPYRVDGILGEPGPCPWAEELPLKLLYVDLPGNAGPVTEAAFLHRASRTLVVTDAVVFIPAAHRPRPPACRGLGEELAASDFGQVGPPSGLPPARQAPDGSWPGYERIRGRVLRAPILRAFGDARPSRSAAGSRPSPRRVEVRSDRLARCDAHRPDVARRVPRRLRPAVRPDQG